MNGHVLVNRQKCLWEISHSQLFMVQFHIKNWEENSRLALMAVLFGTARRPLGSDQSCGETAGRRPSVSTQHFSLKSWCFRFLRFSTFLLHALTESAIKIKQIYSWCVPFSCAEQKRMAFMAELTSLHWRIWNIASFFPSPLSNIYTYYY